MSFDTISIQGRNWEIKVYEDREVEIYDNANFTAFLLNTQGEYKALLRALRQAARKLGWGR